MVRNLVQGGCKVTDDRRFGFCSWPWGGVSLPRRPNSELSPTYHPGRSAAQHEMPACQAENPGCHPEIHEPQPKIPICHHERIPMITTEIAAQIQRITAELMADGAEHRSRLQDFVFAIHAADGEETTRPEVNLSAAELMELLRG